MKNIAHLAYGLAIIIAGISGGLFVHTIYWLGAGNRPAVDIALQAHSVELNGIANNDRWISNCDVFFAPITNVRSKSSYAALVIVPKINNFHTSPVMKHKLVLSGFDPSISKIEKPIILDGQLLNGKSTKPIVVLLDFLTFPIAELKEQKLFLRSEY